MRVWRGDLQESDIEGQALFGGEERGDIGQEDGRVAGASAIHRISRVRADEERAQAKVTFPARIGIGRRPIGVQVRDLDIMQRLAARDQRLQQRSGRGAGPLDEDAIARLHGGDRFFQRTPDRHATLPPFLLCWRMFHAPIARSCRPLALASYRVSVSSGAGAHGGKCGGAVISSVARMSPPS